MWNELRNDLAVKMHVDRNTIWFRLKTITLCCEETSWLANSQKRQGTILQWDETLINRHRQPLSCHRSFDDTSISDRTGYPRFASWKPYFELKIVWEWSKTIQERIKRIKKLLFLLEEWAYLRVCVFLHFLQVLRKWKNFKEEYVQTIII